MTITVKQAIKHFFASPSFEMIYSEAVANALDAGATNISIAISIKSFQAKDSIQMIIRDNGSGFTDENFKRFQSLLQSKDENHKGLGRLVYLAYFNKVHVESTHDGTKHRLFDFTEDFNGESVSSVLSQPEASYSQFAFSGFSNSKFSKYNDLIPKAIKDLLKKQFMARLFMLKAKGQDFFVDISLDVEVPNKEHGFVSSKETLTLNDLPDLKRVTHTDAGVDFFDNEFTMLYSVLKDEWKERATASVCVDGRAVPFPHVFKQTDLPNGVSAIFLLESSYFNAKADDARQTLRLNANEERNVIRLYQRMIADVLVQEVPEIKSTNDTRRNELSARFPHLQGLFPDDSVGLINSSRALEYARDKFFKEQKEILEASELTDELYAKSLGHSTRVLAEYILYRKLIIDKIASVDPQDKEATIHNLIVPMQQTFEGTDCRLDLYRNNAWVLDDKYMMYKSILSDKDLKNLIEKIAFERDDLKATDIRPDIALVFSDDIEKVDHPVDVVIVELKKKGLGYLDNTRILDQIRMRARRLVSLYPGKIQRVWFFGIVDFDPELMVSMTEDKWAQIYSTGTVYYKQLEVQPIDKDKKPLSQSTVPVPVTLMSFDALVGDAKARNETFLTILRNSIREYAEQAIVTTCKTEVEK